VKQVSGFISLTVVIILGSLALRALCYLEDIECRVWVNLARLF
jgi:hypothetical protein